MEHALARRSSGVVPQARPQPDLDHTPVVGKQSRTGGGQVAPGTAPADPHRQQEDQHQQQIERLTRELAAIATAALPAYVQATRREGLDPIAHQLEVMRAAHRVQHLLMVAGQRVRAVVAARPQDLQVAALRATLDQLVAHATALGVDRPASEVRARTPAPRAARGSATGARPAPGTPGPASIESPHHKERGWIKPATGASEDAPHVGAVYFQTKAHAVDAGDRMRFLELAKRYAAAARRGLGTRAGAAGLKGRIIGYADPRRTRKPDNEQLSRLRADAVATELGWALAIETRLNIEKFSFERVGAGVAPGAPESAEAAAEGNLLAPFRRADLYLEGRASDAATPGPVVRDARTEVRPPDAGGLLNGWDRWKPLIEQGHKGTINGVAVHIYGSMDSGLNAAFKDLYLKLGGVAPRKPPWWDGRAEGLPHQAGYRSAGRSAARNAAKARESRMIGKALLLIRDAKEFAVYFDHHASSYQPYLDELAKRPPDPARLEELITPLGHLHFMMNENRALAREVMRLSEGT